jgi:hypothetical protein
MKVAVFALAAGALYAQLSHPPVNADSVTIQDFEKRVSGYLQMRKTLESKLPPLKSSPSQGHIAHHEHELARLIREARKTAKPGDIFTPEIAAEIRRLIAIAMQPGDGKNIRQSLHSSEPVQLNLNINQSYPSHVPLQSTPPSLLVNLPPLPPDLEYRVIGRDLILLDTKANLIVDIVSGIFS